MGTAFQGTDYLIDSINEKGLAVGLFYFPTFASCAETTRDNEARSVAVVDFGTWLLTNFATLDEVRAAVGPDGVVIAPTLAPGFPPEPQPVHFAIYDKTGASNVIEPLDGKLKVYDNPLGVIANSRTFDWHMTNLRNYVALNPRNVPPVTINGTTFRQLGQGSGMLGLACPATLRRRRALCARPCSAQLRSLRRMPVRLSSGSSTCSTILTFPSASGERSMTA